MSEDRPILDLGRIAYEAYVVQAGGVSLATGAPLPTWSSLPPAIADAWKAAAGAAAMAALEYGEAYL